VVFATNLLDGCKALGVRLGQLPLPL
jgi:hypothetical protein